MKRIIALMVMFLMLIMWATSCKGNTETKDPYEVDAETRELYDTVVLVIDGVPITYEKYRYYFNGIADAYAAGDENYFTSDPERITEVREAVLEELKLEMAIRQLAQKYGIVITDKDWEDTDSYLTQLDFYYQTNLGIPLKQDLAANYATYEVYRELYAYGAYIRNGLYDYIYNRENKVIDFSKDTVTEFMKDFYCTIHILLTKENYQTEEKALEVAQRLYRVLDAADKEYKSLPDGCTAEQVIASIEKVEEAYETEKDASSFMEGFAGYMGYLSVLKEELSASKDHAAFHYLKDAADKLNSGETAVTTLQQFANKLVESDAAESTLEEYDSVFTLYNGMINDAIKAYRETGTVEYPTSAQINALFGMKLVGVILREESIASFAKDTLGDAFSNAVRLFGEDREDPDHGIYFKKGEIEENFEKVFFELKVGEMSQPVKTEYGIHLILRVENDYEYFADTVYETYAVDTMILEIMNGFDIEYKDIYDTITPATLK